MTEPKTVTPRIALAVGPDGEWYAIGGSYISDDDAMALAIEGIDGGCARYWVTVTAPVPAAQEVAGKVEAHDQ